MADRAPSERLLAGFLRAILDADFSPSERRVAAEAIRSGQLTECILHVLEYDGAAQGSDLSRTSGSRPSSQTSSSSAKDLKVPLASDRRPDGQSVDGVFKTIRRRKIPKVKLIQMLEHLSPELDLDVDDTTSMRELLKEFKERANDVEWVTLSRMISGDTSVDAYLRNILRR